MPRNPDGLAVDWRVTNLYIGVSVTKDWIHVYIMAKIDMLSKKLQKSKLVFLF